MATKTSIRQEMHDLGRPEALRGQAASATLKPVKFNTHIHLPPNFSAFSSVEQPVEMACDENVQLLGVSNYYDYGVYEKFAEIAKNKGIFPLFGTEVIGMNHEYREAGKKINDPGNPGKIYICGKGMVAFETLDSQVLETLNQVRRNDAQRMAEMIQKMNAVFQEYGLEVQVTEAGVVTDLAERYGVAKDHVFLQERHVAQAFQEALFSLVSSDKRADILAKLAGQDAALSDPDDAVEVQGKLRSYLMKSGKPAFVPETFVAYEPIREMLLGLGGIPTYPTLADGTKPICPFESPLPEFVDRLKALGFHAVEFIPIRNSPSVLKEYVLALRGAGLIVTAGTEHNTQELLPIEPTCVDGQGVPEEALNIFWEGACVVAAHQFLTAHDEVGYVDASGELNHAYDNQEDRITALAKLGQVVLHKYWERTGQAEMN